MNKTYIRTFFLLLALMLSATGTAWADDKSKTQNGFTVMIEKSPNEAAGNVTIESITTAGLVTLKITPAAGYSINTSMITAEPMVALSRPARGNTMLADAITISPKSPTTNDDVTSPTTGDLASGTYTFTIPSDYTGAYVTVRFFKKSSDTNVKQITSLSEITASDGNYELMCDVVAPSSSNAYTCLATFTGKLTAQAKADGTFPVISGLTKPLFTTATGATISNIILESVSISSGDANGNTGAIACVANGATRIYNCGILPTSAEYDNDGNITGFSGSSVSGTGNVGGLVGFLDGTARVINCYSYANITGGTMVGGIVGYNNVATTSSNLKTMVFCCMFYGDITGGTNKAPIYNGEIITNVSTGTGANNKGVSNFNYFRAEASYVQNRNIDTYNCALLAETRYLQRFEFFRHLLNGHRELAAWWASTTSNTVNPNEMAKWVMEPSQIGSNYPYPILKVPGYYPSVVNIDAENATTQTERNKGGKLGTLTVYIQMGDGEVFTHPGTGDDEAKITTPQKTLNITDKDPDHFNFNYYKVQLPYYNDVGTKNYTGNRVVTGWKIVKINGGTTVTGTLTTGKYDVEFNADGSIKTMPYNYADRNCTAKDLYNSSTNKRVFNQGAYWDVPEGVTSITIEPYWGKAVYLADANADVVYNKEMTASYPVPNVGGGQKYTNGNSYPIAGENQVVYTTIGNAIASSGTALFAGVTATSHTVYDYAVVLVGNSHNYNSISADGAKPYTVTSIDLDGDNEPDYSYILRFDSRKGFHPVRYDFLNLVGLGMAQKSDGGTGTYNFGIPQPKYWFEVTNTALFRVTQMEYDTNGRNASPYILHGGVIEQWVSGQSGGVTNATTYILVGGNVWFKEFHLGCHLDKTLATKHPPVSVTGGDYDVFYLTGLYSNAGNAEDNAECYINGGRFGTVAGTGMEGIGKTSDHSKGHITWQIDNADIENFYGGGINAAKPAEGNINTIISNSHVGVFCGGPQFGDMNSGRTVKTTATGCTFGTFYGAGYGGNSYYTAAPGNFSNVDKDPWISTDEKGFNLDWDKWVRGEIKSKSVNSGNYANGTTYTGYHQDYIAAFGGVSSGITYEFLPVSDNTTNVARLFLKFVKFSLATTRSVTSTLTDCIITGNFFGGGRLGKVDGDVTSTLTDCKVYGNVYGAGFSAELPTVEMMETGGFKKQPYYDKHLGVYLPGEYKGSETYTWEHAEIVNETANAIDPNNPILYTTENLDKSNLGSVSGNVSLTIKGNSKIGTAGDATKGNVYGGGDQSYVTGTAHKITVTLEGNTQVLGNVFGGGNNGVVEGSTEVIIQDTPAQQSGGNSGN